MTIFTRADARLAYLKAHSQLGAKPIFTQRTEWFRARYA